MSNVIPRRPKMTFEQRERAISMLTPGMSARDVARHFQCHETTISRLLNRFQQTGNFADRPRSGRPRTTTPRGDRFLTTSSRHNRFLSIRKLGRLLRNATGTRVRDRTVRNRLHAARLKACRPYVGIPLTRRNLSSLLLYRICNNITLGFSNMIMPVHTMRGIPGTSYASITSMCCGGLQDHRISLPWDHLDRQVRERHAVNIIRDLERALQAEWVRIPLQVIRKLICSMRRLCLAVLTANGGHTSY